MIKKILSLLGKKYRYEDILKLNQESAKKAFYDKFKNSPSDLYIEMVEHEEKYHSFVYHGKANLKNPTKGELFMQGIFTLEKSEELRLLAIEIDKKAKLNGEKEPNLLKEAILAKGAQDIATFCKK